MKTTKKEITRVLLLVSVITLAMCERLESGAARREELEAAIARTKRRLQENLLRVEEHERRHQALLESMKEDQDGLMNVTSVLEVLHRISRTSTRDLRALTKGLKDKSDATLQEAKKEIEREQEKKTLLVNRWWRAKAQLRRSKREQEAMDRATLHQAQTLATKTEATLEEADSLRRLRQKIDLVTERVRTHPKVGRQEGILSRWRRRLSSLFRARTSKSTPDKTVAEANPVSQSPDPETNEKYDITPLEKYSERLDDPMDNLEWNIATGANKEETNPVDHTGSDTETEYIIEEADVEYITGRDTEMEAPTEETDAMYTGYDTDTEAPSLPDPSTEGTSQGRGTVPSQEEAGGASPQDLKESRPKMPFMWLVYLQAAVSLAVAAVRVYDRQRVRRRRRAH